MRNHAKPLGLSGIGLAVAWFVCAVGIGAQVHSLEAQAVSDAVEGHQGASLRLEFENRTGLTPILSGDLQPEIGAAGPSGAVGALPSSFVNWENAPIHPIDLNPSANLLAVCNLPDNRLEIFSLGETGLPEPLGSVPVGLDPVSVRFRTDTEAWVANHISDSISVVDLNTFRVIATIQTSDEPADVVFAGATRSLAFVTCSQANKIEVFDPETRQKVTEIAIGAEDPRALAVSRDGSEVYAAIFESGNETTVVRGGSAVELNDQTGVNDPDGPYQGRNPPPNDGENFNPPINPNLPPPPTVPLLVRKNDLGRWMDDNEHDWTRFISGDKAIANIRFPGWDLPDRDVAIIDAESFGVRYATGLMNICMALAVNPVTGAIAVVGSDATNEIRFEPLVKGKFLRVNVGLVDPSNPDGNSVVDMNPHLDYTQSTIAQSQRDLSLGDPRGIVWNGEGTRAYVTGMGSNNLVVLDAQGARAGQTPTIELGEGPTGLAFDRSRNLIYVLNRFEASISIVNASSESEVARVSFYDPTPPAVRLGRRSLYNTHETSGLGHIACGSCHVDARMDRLAWDLGDPAGEMQTLENRNMGMGLFELAVNSQNHHPMKGPMTTQTLQDIIGHEPHHWRGDRDGIESFNGAFIGLQGDDEALTAEQMQQFEDLLATIHFPPNPFRNFDNTLPTALPLDGHYTNARFGAPGRSFDPGDARNGLARYVDTVNRLDGDNAFSCVMCHTLPTGLGADMIFNSTTRSYQQIAVGEMGEHHLALVSVDGDVQRNMKTPQLRNLYEKVGMETSGRLPRAGFGFGHAGRVPTLAIFVGSQAFDVQSDQEIADLVAFMLAFSGSDLPQGSVNNIQFPPGPPSKDTHAAVGKQVTIVTSGAAPLFGAADFIDHVIFLASEPNARVGLVARGRKDGINRGWFFDPQLGVFQSDRDEELITSTELRILASAANPITYTVVPAQSARRIGVDRDEDGFGDRTELDRGSDPADPLVVPPSSAQSWNTYD